MRDTKWGHFQAHVIQRYPGQYSLSRMLARERKCLEYGPFHSLMSCVFQWFGFFSLFLPWITNVKLLFLWGIFFVVSKNYLTLSEISCNSCPHCHKDLPFTLQEVPCDEYWKTLQQKWEQRKPFQMDASYTAGSIRAISHLEALYTFC